MNFIKNNWKKIAFISPVAIYGIHSAKTHYDITKHMCNVSKEICNSEKSIVNKRVLVILNPVANKKSAEKTFKKYCEPILHLAGFSVDIIKTQHIGHAKTISENLKALPDAIIIAGGDGTSSEVVTGLLRRLDKACPIVLLPLGYESRSALKYHSYESPNKYERIKVMTTTLLNMIKDNIRKESVIKYDVIGSQDSHSKSIYGLGSFSWGAIRDLDSIKDNYWIFGSLRQYAATLFNLYSTKINWNIKTKFIYTPPCAGCRNCYIEQENTPSSYVSRFLTPKNNLNKMIYKNINENCKIECDGHIETSAISIKCFKTDNSVIELQSTFSRLLRPGLNLVNIISDITTDNVESAMSLKSRTIKLLPEVSKQNQSYSIDGEEYDARDIMLTVMPNVLKIFA